MILGLALIFSFISVYLLATNLGDGAPVFYKNFSDWRLRAVDTQRRNLKEMMLFIDPKQLVLFNIICPLISAAVFGLLGRKFGSVLVGVLIGFCIGFVVPSILLKQMMVMRKKKFSAQISDGLMILSSCLKGGLSLLQSIEVLVEEMPAPINQEFGLLLRENKMGMALEESFETLNKRMPSEELNMLTTAVLVARETGGDITLLFTTLINTIRVKLKIMDQVRTLSLQSKIQGIVMSFLPIGFAMTVYSFNPNYFDIMLSNPTGRMLLLYAVVSEIIGIWLIRVFSKVDV